MVIRLSRAESEHRLRRGSRRHSWELSRSASESRRPGFPFRKLKCWPEAGSRETLLVERGSLTGLEAVFSCKRAAIISAGLPRKRAMQEEKQTGPTARAAKLILPTTIAMGAVGFAVGMFSGLSASPIVSTVLPLLFATVGGSAGLYFFSTDPSKAENLRRIRLAAIGVSSFAFACVVSAIYGVSLRTGNGLQEFVPRWNSESSTRTIVTDGTSADDLKLALLGAKLRLLGISPADERKVLDKARAELSAYPNQNVVTDMRLLREKVRAALVPLQGLMSRLEKEGRREIDGAVTKGINMHPVVESLYHELISIGKLCDAWLTLDTQSTNLGVPRSAMVGAVSDLKGLLTQAHGSPRPATRRPQLLTPEELSIYEWFEAEHEEVDYRPILALEQTVLSLSRDYGAGDWLGTNGDGEALGLADAVDNFLDKHAAGTSPEAAEPHAGNRPHIKP
jgi:hypothetical protein